MYPTYEKPSPDLEPPELAARREVLMMAIEFIPRNYFQ